MKHLLVGFVALVLSFTVSAEAVIKEVCEPVKDKKGEIVKNKDGSDKQTCKKIKTHKKVEGEKVPDGKK